MTAGHEVHCLKVREARRADLALVRLVGAVGDEIDAELALRRLDRRVNLAGRHVIAFGVELEVMDERFHRALHLAARGRHDLVVVDRHASLPFRRAQLLDALLHDLRRLAHLLHADEIAVVAVAVLADRDVEIHFGIAFVRLRLAQVPGRARAAHHHAGEAPVPGVGQRHHANVDVALLEDAVVGQQRIEIVDHLEERIAESPDVVDELRRQVLVHAARTEVVGVHARAGSALVEHHQLLALLEAPQRRGERADVHRLRRDVQEMREQTADLGIEDADQLRTPGHLDAEQLLHRQAEGVLLVHRRDVIEPVEIRYRLRIGLGLDQLLGAAMQQADMRIDALDHLTVELEHEAQHAVRGRMLRPEIDREIADGGFCHHATSAAAAFCATRELNLSQATTTRSCVPSPIRSTPSWARTLKTSLRPSTLITSASTSTVMPGGVAAAWLTLTCVPSEPSPASRYGPSSSAQAHSISTIMKPVANTFGIPAMTGDSG